MHPLFFQPVRVATNTRPEDGFLVFADHCLVAVITPLQTSVSGELRSHWFLKAGFGPCAVHTHPAFEGLDKAELWMRERVAGQ